MILFYMRQKKNTHVNTRSAITPECESFHESCSFINAEVTEEQNSFKPYQRMVTKRRTQLLSVPNQSLYRESTNKQTEKIVQRSTNHKTEQSFMLGFIFSYFLKIPPTA